MKKRYCIQYWTDRGVCRILETDSLLRARRVLRRALLRSWQTGAGDRVRDRKTATWVNV